MHFTVSDVSNCNMLDILRLTDKTFLKDFKQTIKSLTSVWCPLKVAHTYATMQPVAKSCKFIKYA